MGVFGLPFFLNNHRMNWELITLFWNCLLSATILPFPSEAFVSFLLLQSKIQPATILFWASLGNCIGGASNYCIGRFARKWIKAPINTRVEALVQRYGTWSALGAWIPFVGDPILIALGVFKAPSFGTITLMSVGKIGRYVVLYLLLIS